jgi:hypothetical protein
VSRGSRQLELSHCRMIAPRTTRSPLVARSRQAVIRCWFARRPEIASLEGDGPPSALDAVRKAGVVELAQRFTEVALLHVEVAKKILQRAARGHAGEALVHVPSLSRLDIQSGGIRSWRHCAAFLALQAASLAPAQRGSRRITGGSVRCATGNQALHYQRPASASRGVPTRYHRLRPRRRRRQSSGSTHASERADRQARDARKGRATPVADGHVRTPAVPHRSDPPGAAILTAPRSGRVPGPRAGGRLCGLHGWRRRP